MSKTFEPAQFLAQPERLGTSMITSQVAYLDPLNTYPRICAEYGPVSLLHFLVFQILLLTHVLQKCIGRSMHPAFICVCSRVRS